MAFCSSNTDTITANNYNDSFSPSSQSCLPNNGRGFSSSDIDSRGNVIASSLTAAVSALLTRKQATAPADLSSSTDTNPANTFTTKSAELRTHILKEYCFYYVRYIWVLTQVLNTAASTTAIVGDPLTLYTTQRTNAGIINSKLNQILQILQELATMRSSSLNTYYGSTPNLDIIRNQLQTHSDQLKSATMETDVQSAMIDYTLEKNASSRNLLGIYSFMNIIAIGILFYLYRSSKK